MANEKRLDNTREKLIELLFDCVSENLTPKQKSSNRLTIEIHHGNIADHLIANGVTVQKWIPVTERLPKKNEMVFVYCKDKTIRGLDVRHIGSCDNGFWFLKTQPGTASFPHPEWKVTHWMPLPEPPKGD